MGKRVFEVAKDLGVDHRELLERCDSLNIDVRNYMSVLNDDDEQKLRGTFTSARKVVEQVQAPGVVRRRRRVAPAEPASRPGVLRVRRKVPQEPVAPEPLVEETPEVAAEAAAPVAPMADAQPESPAVQEAPPKVESVAEAAETNEAPTPEAKAPEAPAAAVPTEAAASPTAAKEAVASTEGAAPAAAGKPKDQARVLGSIPLEQLQRRTVRPQSSARGAQRGGPRGCCRHLSAGWRPPQRDCIRCGGSAESAQLSIDIFRTL